MQRTKMVWVALGAVASIGCSSSDPMTRPISPNAGSGSVSGTGGGGAASGQGGSAGTVDNPTNSGAGGLAGVGSGPVEECVNLQCQVARCAGDAKTTISGRIFDPAGRNPLYNVVAYVPNEPVLPFPEGAACDDCSALYTGHPIATGLSDATGAFVIEDAPSGANIPLVIQVGKWRRQFVVPMVNDCTDNPVDEMLRLPRNRSEGDIPKIAISTGSADTLECLLRRVGVDPAEYVPGGGDGRVQIFKGTDRTMGGFFGGGGGGDMIAPNTNPPGPMATTALWNATETLMQYDIVLLSCEGQETQGMNQQALFDYANAGGRVFASHYHYSWLHTGPFGDGNLAIWRRGSQAPEMRTDDDLGEVNGSIVTELPNGDPFPKGQALLDWLTNVGALQNGTLRIEDSRFNAIVDGTHMASQSWITAPGTEGLTATQYFSFNTPIGGTMQVDGPPYCGRVVFSDLHVGAASGDDPMMPVPNGCTDRALSPQEAALEFMLFDLSSCVTPDDVPPQPPVVE